MWTKRIPAWPKDMGEGLGSGMPQLSQAREGPSPLFGAWEMQSRSSALLPSTFHCLIPNSQSVEGVKLCSHSLCTFSLCEDSQTSHPTAPKGLEDPELGTTPLSSCGEKTHPLTPMAISSLSPASLWLCTEETLSTCPWGLKSCLGLSCARVRAVYP